MLRNKRMSGSVIAPRSQHGVSYSPRPAGRYVPKTGKDAVATAEPFQLVVLQERTMRNSVRIHRLRRTRGHIGAGVGQTGLLPCAEAALHMREWRQSGFQGNLGHLAGPGARTAV